MLAPDGSTRFAATLALLGVVAFVNALGSVIVFPLAPFLATDLGIPPQDAAFSTVYFNGAAGIGGLAGALLLARVRRVPALCATLAGLAVSSAGAALAPNFATLLLARLAGGLCAGPLLGILMTAAADVAPGPARGRAISAIVASYGLALLLGSPMALALVSWTGTWRASFGVLSGLCASLILAVHLVFRARPRPTSEESSWGIADVLRLLATPGVPGGLLLPASASFATLLISPHLGTFALKNGGLTVAELGLVYLIGGTLALFTAGITGWALDQFGPALASAVVGLVLTPLLATAFLASVPAGVLAPILGLTLAAQLARSTVAQASASRVPRAKDRVAFQCLVSATTSFAQAAGAAVSTVLLSEGLNGHLVGMGWLAGLSIALCWIPLWLIIRLERQIAATA
jgi:DHA1 family inner membrane transport protein